MISHETMLTWDIASNTLLYIHKGATNQLNNIFMYCKFIGYVDHDAI
jgi:hypothetical protein